MKYELILFDADGTLYDYDNSEEYALQQAFIYFNLKYDKDQHLKSYRIINSEVWSEFEKNAMTVEELRIIRFTRLFKEFNIEISEKEFSEVYLDYLSKGSFLIDGAEEVVSYLSPKCKLAIITNGIKSVQNSRIKNSTLSKYFEGIIISEDAGYPKPNKEIFQYTFEKLSHEDKKTVLIVGDSLTSDIKGGQSFGIDTCWFNPRKKENCENIKPTYEIESLQQLKELLAG